jgi:hypothetical protein
MSSSNCSLHYDFRAILQDKTCLSFEGTREKYNGGKDKYDKGINSQQRHVLPFSPQKGRQCKVKNVSLPVNPSHFLLDVTMVA